MRSRVLRAVLGFTAICIVGSLAISVIVTYLATGDWSLGLGFYIAILAPAILVPIGSYSHISLATRLRDANEKLKTLSQTDPLTGTFNRRQFLEVAETQLGLARRHGFPTSLLLIDFDRFKEINDRLGHPAGDQVLVDASKVIEETLRDSDTLARFGGEEFVVLLPHTAREGALMVADRVLESIRRHDFRHGGESMDVTVSIGGATSEASRTSLEQLTSTADAMMYRAKRAGRDQCMIETIPHEGMPRVQEPGEPLAPGQRQGREGP